MTGLFGVGAAFVNKMLRLHRTGADVAPRPYGGGYPARLLPRHEKLLRSQVRPQQDATLEELRTTWRSRPASPSASRRSRGR